MGPWGTWRSFHCWEEGPFPEILRLHCKTLNKAPFPSIPGSRRNRIITEATGERGQEAGGEASMQAARHTRDREMRLLQIPRSRLNHKPEIRRCL